MSLYAAIFLAYEKLVLDIAAVPLAHRSLKEIDGAGGKISVIDLIAYQIGWGTCLIRWYEAGIRGETPEMPGNGFSKWDYVEIARSFYRLYQFDSCEEQMNSFHQIVRRILEIVETEEKTGHLDRIGVWAWCTLSSGKQWPLSKWIRVNTASPYKRASSLIRKLV